ncbi:hypothetical protein LCGC14_1369540 [marine sediment metagenome]|uniref:Uncharacterized protein n=1 Tax=marine sediment metagenome TaxID=412755 RepID=A0A0F9KRN5_9ZZZZ
MKINEETGKLTGWRMYRLDDGQHYVVWYSLKNAQVGSLRREGSAVAQISEPGVKYVAQPHSRQAAYRIWNNLEK